MTTEEFRQESLITLLLKWLFSPFWIFMFFAITVMSVVSYLFFNEGFTGAVFFSIAFVLQFSVFSAVNYYHFKRGKNLFEKIPNLLLIENVGIYSIGFDSLSNKKFMGGRKNHFSFSTSADIGLANGIIYFLGKTNFVGTEGFLPPRVFLKAGFSNDYDYSYLKSYRWSKNGKLEIEIEDPEYSKTFRIGFKTHSEEVYNFLKDSPLEIQHS